VFSWPEEATSPLIRHQAISLTYQRNTFGRMRMHPRAQCAARYPSAPRPVLWRAPKREPTIAPARLATPHQSRGQNRNDSCGPAPDVVFRIRRSHGRGIRVDRWPGIGATLRPPSSWFGALCYLVPRGTEICPPLMIDKATPVVRNGMEGAV
jgi:hypothetical protein